MVRVVHGPVRLIVATEDPLPAWVWPEVADMSALVKHLADQLEAGRPDESRWQRVAVERDPDAAEQFALVDGEPTVAEAGDVIAPDDTSPVDGAHPPSPEPAPPPAGFEVFTHRPSTVDYAEVARVAREALANGRPIVAAIMKHFGCSKTAASQRVTKARQSGHDIPYAQSGRPPTGKADASRIDYAVVAEIARKARADSLPMSTAVAAHFGCTREAAKMRIAHARRLGHDIPPGDHGVATRGTKQPRPAPVVRDIPKAQPTEPAARLPDVPSGLGPIDKVPFDAEAARERALGGMYETAELRS